MNDVIETINYGNINGFNVEISQLVEYMNPSECFDPCMIDEIYEKLERHEIEWFCVKVSCYKKGIKLSSNYLGGCLYESLEDFIEIEKDRYLNDLIIMTIEEAKQKIKELIN